MKNYTKDFHLLRFHFSFAILSALVLVSLRAGAQDTEPPFFTGPTPADVVVSCVADVPNAVNREANDAVDPTFPKMISPTDAPSPSTIDCAGGLILRVWEAMDAAGNVARDTQRITILPDESGPVVLIPEPRDTFYCESRNEVANDFLTWVDTRQLELFFQNEECNLDRIENNAPDDFDTPCGAQEVVFTLYDECGFSTEWKAYYIVVDTLAPVLTGVPDDVDLGCGDALPPLPPAVTAADNCSDNLPVNFVENSTQLMDGSCNQYEYTVLRIWSATDICGNTVRDTQRIAFLDNAAPTLTKPADITINCTDDATDFSLTGEPTNVGDDCGGPVNLTFSDRIVGDRNTFCYDVERTWRASDVCGNTLTTIQYITVRDSEMPTFTPPPDVTVDCSEGVDPSITGEPTMIADNCDPEPGISFIDTEIAGSCENNPIINRLWRVTDACGNRRQLTQVITVTDLRPPAFSNPAQDRIIACESGVNLEQSFQEWLANRGGARAADNCSPDATLRWFAYNSGTTDAPTLPLINCGENDRYVRFQSVDFIVEDECGARDTTTAVFAVEDTAPPVFLDCPVDTMIVADPGDCGATFQFFPPAVEESCGSGSTSITRVASSPITSSAAPGQESDVPVDPIDLSLDFSGALPINALGNATLRIFLNSVDGEAAGERFNIFDEDGALLGRTTLTSSQCGASETTISIPAGKINRWIADGAIRFRLEPNIPAGQAGRFAINDICPNGSVGIQLNFSGNPLEGLSLAYRLNDGPRESLTDFGLYSVRVEEGMNQLTLYAIDCVGNIDSCAFLVNVMDREAPQSICPDDIFRLLGPDSCVVPVRLPLPKGVTDNCSESVIVQRRAPRDTASAYLTFNRDPNLNDYLAEEKILTFNSVTASAISDVRLQFDFRGDLSSPGAFFNFYNEDGGLLGSTVVGAATCGSPSQLVLTILKDDFNRWAADGELIIRAVPNDIPVPPGQPGDGINPCDPQAVGNDGDNDGQSYLFGRIRYESLIPDAFFTEGATVTPITPMLPPAITPTVNFSYGVTDVHYLISDDAGNLDTCSFQVTVDDQQAPAAVCQTSRAFINPSGLQFDTIPASVIDGGSMDNCEIDTMFITPNVFSCEDAGLIVPVTLTVRDKAGNTSNCSTMVRVETEGPAPTANSGLCGGDTLFLFANPPPATGGVIYTYRWTGPNGFASTLRNPIIPNVDTDNEGSYVVEVVGITGCSAVGAVEVAIRDLPLSARVVTDGQICMEDDIQLMSSEVAAGSRVQYEWYEGLPPNGMLLGTTATPAFTLPGPHALPPNTLSATKQFYLIIESDDCRSTPSIPTPAVVSQKPVAAVNQSQIEVCEGESVSLGTPINGPGITYQWTGPNDFSSTAQFPAAIANIRPAAGGLYRLVVYRYGCPSEPVFVNVTVLPKPAAPLIFNNGPVCEGGQVTLSTNIPNASVYHWISSTRPDEIAISTPTLELTNLKRSDAANWRVYVTQFGCVSDLSEPTPVVVNAIPAAEATAEPEGVCEGQPLRLLGLPNIVNATYRWAGPRSFSSAQQNPVINDAQANQAGQYILTVTSPEGCVGKDTIDIDVVETSFITGISNDASGCLRGPTDITLVASVFPPDNGEYEYRWTTPNGGTLPDQSVVVLRNATSSQNGTYRLTVINDNGCASTQETMLLQVADPPATPPAPVPDRAPPICEDMPLRLAVPPYAGGSVEYIWDTPVGEITTTTPVLNLGNIRAEDNGAYTVIAKVNGCESGTSNPYNLQVNPVPVIEATSNGPVCSGSVINLSVTDIPGANYTWIGPGFTSSLRNPRISQADSILHAGEYRVVATLNGCASNIDTIDLVVKPRPRRPVAASSASFCVDDPNGGLPLRVVEMSATPGANYFWSDGFGEGLGSTRELEFRLTDLDDYGDGLFAFSVQAEVDGCFSNASAPTNVTMSTIPAIEATAGLDTIVCEGAVFTLGGNTPGVGTGAWSWVGQPPMGVTIDAPAMGNSTVAGLSKEGSYTLRWTLSNGACRAYDFDEVTLQVKALIIPEAGEDQLACASETITLDAATPAEGEGRWSQSNVQALLGVGIADPLNPNTTVQGLEAGNLYSFTWTITEGCGNLSDEVLILISDPNPDAGRDSIVCNDDAMVILNAAEPTEGSSGQWSSPNPELVFSNTRNRKATVMDLAPGENMFIWTIDQGICGPLSRDTVVLFYKDNPVARPDDYAAGFGVRVPMDLLANDYTPPGSFVVIKTPPRYGTVEETDDNQFVYVPDFNHIGMDEFIYELCSGGCECAEARVTLDIGADADCAVPSIITPNGDGVNDFFVIPCLFDENTFPHSQVVIINQWGDEVYRSGQPYGNNWGGTFNGEALPVGTYFYMVDLGNGEEQQTGYLVIYR